jgi:signal transduction histidine kinase
VDRELREAAARRAQHEAVRQVEELRAKGRETDRMVSAATHELRSPLGPIKLELYMLLQGKFGDLNAEQRQAAQIVDRSARQLEALIHDLFDVTRMQAGQLLVQPAPIDLAAVAREGVAAMQGPASEAGIALSLDAPVPAPVLADPLRMGQVLRNFVGNALKFTPAGGAIRVRVAAAGERVQLLVTDTGLGLRAEDLGRLFQPFSQVANPLHQKHSGAGLGLSISKGIADQHGGRVWAASDGPGHGSTFGFELPRRQG